jgi:hypothetical protein
VDPDETIHNEAYEKLLETWLSLVGDTSYLDASIIQPYAAKVFNMYMMCHLSPPRGSRIPVSQIKILFCFNFFLNSDLGQRKKNIDNNKSRCINQSIKSVELPEKNII